MSPSKGTAGTLSILLLEKEMKKIGKLASLFGEKSKNLGLCKKLLAVAW